MERRGYLRHSQLFWIIALIPLFGPLIYLSWRPPLPLNFLHKSNDHPISFHL